MKIFAAGIATETNTFSPIPTSLEDFFVQRGKDVLAGRIDHPSLDLSVIWGEQAKQHGYEFCFSLNAWAQPSGMTSREAYESLRDEVLQDLRTAMPVDIVLLNLHGAMVAHGYDDCEEDIIRRVRAIAGEHAIVGVELDLHCHLSPAKIESADLVILYKEYPHVDIHERARELFRLAVDAKLGRIRPTMAIFDCRMIGLYPTSRQPMREFVDSMMQAEGRNGVLSVSFGHGFQFADLPHLGAKMLVVTDNDQAQAKAIAEEFGLRVYRMRQKIGVESLSLPLEDALSKALASPTTPVVVADQSDNPGGGAPGDATFALRWLLNHDAREVALAILHDPEVVKTAKKAGKGATLSVRLGGKIGPSSGDPVDLEVTVSSVLDDYMHEFPQQSGEPAMYSIGDVVALHGRGIDIVVGSKRCQCLAPSIFSDLGIDPKRKRVLIPKSAQHFYGAFAPIASEVIYMTGPGAVPPDPRKVSYHRIDPSRLYPWTGDPLSIAASASTER